MDVATIKGLTQYLSFMLGKEVFALDISKVREVLDYTPITKIPKMPKFMRGVINLRGGGVPVVDMRLKLGMPQTERTLNTCIIIAEVALDDAVVVIGALADGVKEVLDLEPGQIAEAPRIGMHLKTEFLTGMGKKGEEFILILDMDRVFSVKELTEVRDRGAAVSFENVGGRG